LDTANETLFKPHGLFACIMSFKPIAPSGRNRLSVTSSIVDASSSYLPKKSSGVSQGNIELPEAAPLIFPVLDAVSDGEKPSFFQKQSAFVGDYADRRKQAQFVRSIIPFQCMDTELISHRLRRIPIQFSTLSPLQSLLPATATQIPLPAVAQSPLW
jgi:hypothetical protein